MLEPAHRVDVVVVGASVAGLSAAQQLTGAGVHTVVLDSRAEPGGHMTTEQLDGFRLDRTGRLLLATYQELRHVPGLDELVLRPFASGAVVRSGDRLHHVGEPARAEGRRAGRGRALPHRLNGEGGDTSGGTSHALQSSGGARSGRWENTPGLRGVSGASRGGMTGARGAARALVMGARPYRPTSFGRPMERARLGAVLARLAAVDEKRLLARPEQPTAEALIARGLSTGAASGLLRPLLSALLCDPDLTTSSRYADLALAAFARGRLCLPEGGAHTLPGRLVSALPPGTVHTGVRVTGVSTTSVTTEEHGEIRCDAVLLATGPGSAAALLPGLRVPPSHPVTVVHHAADEPPFAGGALLVDADRAGPVAHTAVASEIDPSRVPPGRVLVSSTVLGAPTADLDRAVRAQLAELYGTSTTGWELLAVHHDPEAVPAMPPPHDRLRPVRVLSGLYVCGEHRDTSTVQGALHSGRRAAQALLADFAAAPAREPEPPHAEPVPLRAVA